MLQLAWQCWPGTFKQYEQAAFVAMIRRSCVSMIGRFPFLGKALQCACLIQHFVSRMAEAQLVTEPARMMCRCCRCSNCVLFSMKTYAVRRIVSVQQHKVCEPGVCACGSVCKVLGAALCKLWQGCF